MVYVLPSWKIVAFGFDYSADRASNNVEEYRGLINGLKSVSMISSSEDDEIIVLGDSQLVINQLCGIYNCCEKLLYLLTMARSYLQSAKFMCRWIPREWNGAADLLSREARRLKMWQDPLQARSMSEWRSTLSEFMSELQQRSLTLGTATAAASVKWTKDTTATHRRYSMVVAEFSCKAGNFTRSCMNVMAPWLKESMSSAAGTLLLNFGNMPRWRDSSQHVRRINPTKHPIKTSVASTDMNALIRLADASTHLIRSKHWDIGKAIRELRGESTGGRPNEDLNPQLYRDLLQSYSELDRMCFVAQHGVPVLLDSSFRPRRPWMKNLPMVPAAVSVAVNKIMNELNLGRGMVAHASVLGRNCPRLTVSPMGAVKKGDEPLSENVRVINALSSPKGNSINSSTINIIPDACFGRVSEIADEVLRLRLLHPDTVRIMAMGADIDSAFKHVPKHADSVQYFAVVIPGTSLLWLSFNLDFGWKGSPGYFALFAKAVRHLQSSGGSFVRNTWSNFYVFVWVDDIILVEPDLDDRLLLAERRLRTSVEQVFGPAGWKESKFDTWSTKWKALGLLWDSSTCTVEMPQAKLDKAAMIIQSMLLLHATTLRDLRSLLGQLRHLSTCVPAARSFVQEIQHLVNLNVAGAPDSVLQLNSVVCSDLEFWHTNILNTNFTAWPMELFGSVGSIAATWTICVMRGRACVFWHEAGVTWIDDGMSPICFSSSVRAINCAFRCWLLKIHTLGIRAPKILVLVPRATWAVAINGGSNQFSDGRQAMRYLAALQLEYRVHFTAMHWNVAGNTIPPSWRQAVREVESNTNFSLQLDLQPRLTNGTESWLCQACARALSISTKNALNPGPTLRPPLEFRHGLTTSPTSNRPLLSRVLWHSSLESASTPGPLLRERLAQSDGCIACTRKWNWSSSIQSSPWWAQVVKEHWPSLGPGNL